MNIQVLSRNQIYIEGEKIRRKRLFFDNYFNHTRDVYIYRDIVIKIDPFKSEEVIKNEDFESYHQCLNEVRIYNKLKPKEKLFFATPIAYGSFKDGHKIGWIAQVFVRKSPISIYEHPHFKNLCEIFDKYNICDMDERNCTIDIKGNLVCFDWGV